MSHLFERKSSIKKVSSCRNSNKTITLPSFPKTKLKTSIYSSNCLQSIDQGALIEPLSARSNPKRFKPYFDLLSNLDSLQKDVSEASEVIEQKILDGKSAANLDEYLRRKIRNQEYKDGLEKIEERLKTKRNEKDSKELKSLRSIITKDSLPDTDFTIGPEDITSSQAVEFLGENKRKFGNQFLSSPSFRFKKSIRPKNKEIKVNPHQTIIEDIKYETSVIKPRNNRCSVPNIYKSEESPKEVQTKTLESKARLPSLSLASILVARAKADANRFFVDRRLINEQLQARKKSNGY